MGQINIDLDFINRIPGELESLKNSAEENLQTVREKLPFEANQLRNTIERLIALAKRQ